MCVVTFLNFPAVVFAFLESFSLSFPPKYVSRALCISVGVAGLGDSKKFSYFCVHTLSPRATARLLRGPPSAAFVPHFPPKGDSNPGPKGPHTSLDVPPTRWHMNEVRTPCLSSANCRQRHQMLGSPELEPLLMGGKRAV